MIELDIETVLVKNCAVALHQMVRDSLMLHPNTELISASIIQDETDVVVTCTSYSQNKKLFHHNNDVELASTIYFNHTVKQLLSHYVERHSNE